MTVAVDSSGIRGRLTPNAELAPFTWFRVGGPAELLFQPADTDDLARFLAQLDPAVPVTVIGVGSNLLVRDGGIPGVTIRLSAKGFGQTSREGETRIRAGAALPDKRLAAFGLEQSLAGFAFYHGIPGTIGGALRMNAGAMGGETFNTVESVRVMDFSGNISELTPKEMSVGYRCCATLKTLVALGAVFQCTSQPREEIVKRMKAFSEKRWSSQPATPSAGCMFANPAAMPAGRLIDELGLKGTKVGGARVSQEHGNFLVNDGGATAKDVLELIEFLQAKAKAERGIDLRTEVEVIGE